MVNWIKFDLVKRLRYAMELLSCVRFPYLTKDFLFSIVQNGELMEWLDPQHQTQLKTLIIEAFHFIINFEMVSFERSLDWKSVLKYLDSPQQLRFQPRVYIKVKFIDFFRQYLIQFI